MIGIDYYIEVGDVKITGCQVGYWNYGFMTELRWFTIPFIYTLGKKRDWYLVSCSATNT
jgi:hypothetical protein